ncbi:hypothetical protein A6V37_38295 [Paraburkholderia ginsengiterrae]|uniref:Uncharacterized protein n=1 Tax=Paraburkholderia ginsengiterrae TaxID=1462993 RepID=A0A1A9N7N1_9BURK|nr:hypothetical protein A6V37_38295 [Paraburkholderia ginsengiterrae]
MARVGRRAFGDGREEGKGVAVVRGTSRLLRQWCTGGGATVVQGRGAAGSSEECSTKRNCVRPIIG